MSNLVPIEDLPDEEQPTPSQKITTKDVVDHYVGLGYKPHHAAGIAANLVQESGLNPNAVNPKSGAFGIAQHLGSRKNQLLAFAEQTGRDVSDPITQMDFIDYELNNTETKARDKLLSTENPTDASISFSNNFERAGENEKNNTRRARIAESIDIDNVPNQSFLVPKEDIPDEASQDWEGSTSQMGASQNIPEEGWSMMGDIPQRVVNSPEVLKQMGKGLLNKYANTINLFGSDINPIAQYAKEKGIPIPADIAENALRTNTKGQRFSEEGAQLADLVSGLGMAVLNPMASIPKFAGMAGLESFATNKGNLEERARKGLTSAASSLALGYGAKGLGEGIKWGGEKAKDIFGRFSEGGRIRNVSKAMQDALGSDAPAIANIIENAPTLVRGVKQTAAGLSQNNPGISALEAIARRTSPQAFGKREAENIAARRKYASILTGSETRLAEQRLNRAQVAQTVYEPAKAQMIPVNNELKDLFKRPIFKKAFNRVVERSANLGRPIDPTLVKSVLNARSGAAIQGSALHDIKVGLDKGKRIAKNPSEGLDQTELQAVIDDFKNWRESNFPDYNKAQSIYEGLSKQIDKTTTARYLKKQAYPPESELDFSTIENPVALKRALDESKKTGKKATGYFGSDINKILRPKEIKAFEKLAEDMQRSAHAKQGPGINLEGGALQSNDSRIARSPAEIMAVTTGVPGSYGLVNSLVFQTLEKMDKKTKETLVDVALNPKKFAKLLKMQHKKFGSDFFNNVPAQNIPGIAGYLLANESNR